MEESNLSNITTYQAGTIQAYVNRKLQKISDAILEPYGITKMQWLIIGNVLDHQNDGVRISDLSTKLGTNMPYMTNSVNLLESRGILIRKENAADSRSKLVAVSEKFIPKCKDIEAALRAALRKTIYAQIKPAEFAIYLKVQSELAQVEDDIKKLN